MAVQYLKKRKLFELAKQVFTDECDLKLSRSEYKFYRGTEWLKIWTDDYVYELCSMHGGNYLSADTYYYDEMGARIHVQRDVLNGFGVHKVNIA